jgi:hypothetical protein
MRHSVKAGINPATTQMVKQHLVKSLAPTPFKLGIQIYAALRSNQPFRLAACSSRNFSMVA